jgi:hypothetical protein
MRILGMLLLVVALSGCAKHGVMIQTDKEYKGHVSIGWGAMSIVDMDVMGATKICVPSKTALENEDQANNWCRSWMEPPKP